MINKPKYIIMMPLWGAEFLNFFFDYLIDQHISLMRECKYRKDILYCISSLEPYRDIISNNLKISELDKSCAGVVSLFVKFTGLPNDNPENIPQHRLLPYMNKASIDFLRDLDCINDSTLYFFIPPDTIYSKGAFQYIIDKCNEGYTYIIHNGVRIDKDKYMMYIKDKNIMSKTLYEPLDLTKMIFENNLLHPITNELILNKDDIIKLNHTTPLLWKINDYGYITKGIHLHPICHRINLIENLDYKNHTTLDSNILNIFNTEKIFWLDDSTKFCTFELSRRHHGPLVTNIYQNTAYSIISFLYAGNLTENNASYLLKDFNIYLKPISEIDKDIWNKESNEFNEYIKKIIDIVYFINKYKTKPPKESPKNG